MATKIYISGNFLIAEDSGTNDIFLKLSKSLLFHLRDSADNYAFFNNTTFLRAEGVMTLNQLGEVEAWNIDNPEPPSQTNFNFSDIVDGDGDPYANSNTFNQLLNDELGATSVVVSNTGFLTYVATDGTLTGDGTPGFPLSVVPLLNNYQERYDPFLPLVGGAWHTVALAGLPANRLVEILCRPTINNQTVGIREIGSLLTRSVRLDVDSSFTMTVRTDALGQIEIFATSLSNDFYVTAYLF